MRLLVFGCLLGMAETGRCLFRSLPVFTHLCGDHRIRRGGMSEATVGRHMYQLLLALEALHKRGITVRTLDPAYIGECRP